MKTNISRTKIVIFLLILLLMISGCGKEEKREFINLQYLNNDSLKNLDYPHDNIGDDYNDNLVKKHKEEFIKWTATIKEVKSDDQLLLQEKYLPEIEVNLEDSIETGQYKKGNIITISGHLDSYIHGLFGTTPKWLIKNGRIEKTSKKDTSEVLAYQKAYTDKKTAVANSQIAEAKKEKEKQAAKANAEKEKEKQEAAAKAKAEEDAKKPISTDFSSFDNPYDKMTDLQKDEYFKKVEGKYVQWTGSVVDVHEKYVTVICENDTLTFDFIKKPRTPVTSVVG